MPVPMKVLDTYSFFKKYGHESKKLNIQALTEFYGLEKEKHRALSDVEQNIEIFERYVVLRSIGDNFEDYDIEKIKNMKKIKSTPKNNPIREISEKQLYKNKKSIKAVIRISKNEPERTFILEYNNGSDPRVISEVDWKEKDVSFTAIHDHSKKTFFVSKIIKLKLNK